MSVLISFIYRYCSLKNNTEVLHTRKAAFIVAISVIFYPMPAIIPNLFTFQHTDESAVNFLSSRYPEFHPVYATISCSSFFDDKFILICLIPSISLIAIVSVLAMIMATKCIRLLNSIKGSLTKATYALQKQLLIVLCFQLAIPAICLVIPMCVLIGAMMIGSINMLCELIIIYWISWDNFSMVRSTDSYFHTTCHI